MAEPGRSAGDRGRSFGSLLRELRVRQLLSQEQLAERAGLSVRTISNLESGRVRRPRGASVGLLSRALGLADADRAGFEAAAFARPEPVAAPPVPDPRPPGPVPAEPPPVAATPAELPLDAYGFTGRDRELDALRELTAPGSPPAPGQVEGSARVCLVSGTPGVGKTALAVHWAHQARARFPDGQLYADLRGHGPGRPREAADVLGRFLRSLGVDRADIPDDPDERAARFRTEVDGRRMLVLLDNAGTVEQVRPLLPGTPSCVVLATSRNSLSGLVVRDGARRLELEPLSAPDAVRLIRGLGGRHLDADPVAAAALAEQCARLPLALRLAAELVAGRPDRTPAELVEEFADEHRRLDLLAAPDDPSVALRVAFSWSYDRLPGPAASAFRLLGVHPGADFRVEDLTALRGADPVDTRQVLDLLVRAHLVEPRTDQRYGMHDLLRAYAVECAQREEPAAARQEALVRLLDHHLRSVVAAMDLLFPSDRDRRRAVRRTEGPLPDLADADAALAWLDGERPNLVDAVVAAAERGAPGHATDLAAVLWRYLIQGHYDDARTVHGHALAAARERGDAAAEATAQHNLATVQWRRGELEEARAGTESALRIRRRLGDVAAEAQSLNNLACVQLDLGEYEVAAGHLQRVLAIRRGLGDRLGEARPLGNLAIALERLGRHTESIACSTRSLELHREAGDRTSEAAVLDNLGLAYRRDGRLAEAYEHSALALRLYRQLGDRVGTATALTSLALVQIALDRPAEALAGCTEALRLSRLLGDRSREAEALNGLGRALCALGRTREARQRHEEAERLARAAGNPYERARALSGLAEVATREDRRPEAERHRREALALYAAMGVAQAEVVR